MGWEELMAEATNLPEVLLQRAREGDNEALGPLLDLYRNYLQLLARTQMGAALRKRLEPSDIVQEALLEAHRDFGRFQGSSERELLVWLRRVLVRNMLDEAKRHTAQARDGRRQQSLEAILEASSGAIGKALAGGGSTPSVQAS